MALTSIRGKDWVFQALWAACPATSMSLVSDSSQPSPSSCYLNIPVTIVFKDGLPSKTLTTDEATGRLKRIYLEKIELDRVLDQHTSGRALMGTKEHTFRAMRKVLHDFMTQNRYHQHQTKDNPNHEEPFVAKVTYADDQIEYLNAKTLEILLRNEAWRLQVLLIQGYVPSLSVNSGAYSQKPTVRSKVDSNVTEAADQFSKSVAKFVEKAYQQNAAQLMNTSSDGDADKSVSLKVDNMQCSFALDHRDKIIFLHADYTAVEIENKRREVEGYLKQEKKSREQSAAEKINEEVISLLSHAHHRGLTIENSFKHFDVTGNGFIDTEALIDGLSRLGIGVTFPVGEKLLQFMGGEGCAFITQGDFERYLASQMDDYKSEQQKKIDKIPKRDERKEQQRSMAKKKKLSELLPPRKDAILDINASQEYDWNHDEINGGHGVKEQGPLPLPEHLYTTKGPAAAGKSMQSMPSWASKRSRQALHQLQQTSKQHAKRRKQDESSLASQKMLSRSQSSSATMQEGDEVLLEDSDLDIGGSSAASINSQSTPNSRPGTTLKRSKSSKSKSPSRASTALNLQQAIANFNLNADQVEKNPDELLHLEHGVIMTYRVLEGPAIKHAIVRTKEQSDSLRYHSILQVREKNLQKGGYGSKALNEAGDDADYESQEVKQEHSHTAAEDGFQSTGAAGSGPKVLAKDNLTLVIVPDLTMSLDTLQNFLEVLLPAVPMLRIVLVGLLGLPNTVWPQSWVLNAELQSKCIANVVNHLHINQRLFFHMEPVAGEDDFVYEHHDNLVFMGFGTGAFHLSRFVGNLLPALQPQIKQSLRSLVFVNGFLKITKKFKLLCRDLRNALLKANIYEANELVSSLHFFDDYLAQRGRELCLQQFWASRRSLRPDPNRDSHQDELLRIEQDRSGLGYLGILEQLRGLIITPDDYDGAAVLSQQTVPIAVVQATENVFVDPKVAAVYSPDQLPPGRFLIQDVVDMTEANAVHVSWLKAGHEILQERTPYILGLLVNLAKLYGMEIRSSQADDNHVTVEAAAAEAAQEEEEVFAVLNYGQRSQRNKTKTTTEDDLDLNFDNDDTDQHTVGMEEEDKADEDEEDSLALEDLDDADSASVQSGHTEATASQQQLSLTEAEQRKQQALLKLKRAQANMERRKKQMRQSRQNQLEIYYLREQEERDRMHEKREGKFMMKEDRRSKFAEEYRVECEIADLSQQIAKEKASELKQLRKQEALKKVEEEMARKRSIRIEQRRQQATALVHKIESEELVLQGMIDGGYDLKNAKQALHGEHVNESLEASNRLMKDLLTCRQKYVESIQRQHIMQTKFDMFVTQLQTIEQEERRLRRAIRLIELNPLIVGSEMNADIQLAELRHSLLSKQETLSEMSALLTQRKQQLYASNRSVILLKLASKERDVLMSRRIQELYQLEANITHQLKGKKMEKENMIVQKDKLRIQLIHIQKRIDLVTKELLRVKAHKGKLIDTDVWIEGVMQRCVTKELKKHLRGEIANAEHDKANVLGELTGLNQTIFDCSDRIAQKKRDADKVSTVTQILQRTYQKYSATTVEEMMKQILSLQQKAQQIELKRAKESDIDKIFLLANSDNLVDKVRLKESEIRTKDERQFVGMDMVIHPEEYLHLSAIEAEQMQFDEDYQCALAKTDLERILKLPEAINLALPFLHTQEEINAHRLLNKFMRNKDEQYFRQLDFLSGVKSGLSDGSTVGTAATSTTEKDMEEAEVIHDILIKQSLRDRIRTSFQDETLTEEEQHWIVLDKLLAPHVYEDAENDSFLDSDVDVEQYDEEDDEEDELDNNAAADNRSHSSRSKASTITKSTAANKSHTKSAASIKSTASSSSLKSKKSKGTLKPVEEAIEPKNPRAIQSMANTIIRPAAMKGSEPSFHKVDTAGEGNMYQHLRERYDADEDLFGDRWACRFTAEQLLALHQSKASKLQHEDEIYVKKLLDKYFVSDEESILGNAKLKTLQEMSNKIIKAMRKADNIAKAEIESNRKQFNNSPSRQLSRQNTASSASGLAAGRKGSVGGDDMLRGISAKIVTEEGDDDDSDLDVAEDASAANAGTATAASTTTGLELTVSNSMKPSVSSSKKTVSIAAAADHTASTSSVHMKKAPSRHRSMHSTENLEDALALGSGAHGRVGSVTGDTAAAFDDDDEEEEEEDVDDTEIVRVWGSWEQVHPASQGKDSQNSYFMLSTFNIARDHPAAFAQRAQESDNEDDDDDDDEDELLPLQQSADSAEPTLSPRSMGLKQLTALPTQGVNTTSLSVSANKKKGKKRSAATDNQATYFICDSVTDLSQQNPRKIRNKIVLLQCAEPMVLYKEDNNIIQARQSRSHYFSIQDVDSCRVLEFTVSIVFQGNFSTHGYKLGRIAAGLFKLAPPDYSTGGVSSTASLSSMFSHSLPIPVGYAPYSACSPNLPQSMGKIVILHQPQDKPIAGGTSFQIVIGSASHTKYSIEVSAKYARTALPVVDDEVMKAKTMQARLPVVLAEIDGIIESLRLAERKFLVCEKLIVEAELETNRCQKGLRIATTKLRHDDEEMTLMEDERRELQREVDIFEVEFSQWTQCFTTRCAEKAAIREGIDMMHVFKREREQEKVKIVESLEKFRRELPSCIFILRNMTEAVNVAASLNTTVSGVSSEEGAASTGDWGGIKITTPAEDVRRVMKQYGFDSLSLEEQQWGLLDQAVNPGKYEWLREAEEKKRQADMAMGVNPSKKKKKMSPALEEFVLSKSEIEYILDTPFSMLNRREVKIRKLLTKYHDDGEFMKKSLSAVAYGFDPHLAERVRSKHPKSYSKEEAEWVSIDRMLHPDIWEYYVHTNNNFLDRHQTEIELKDESEKTKKKAKKDAINALVAVAEADKRGVSEEKASEGEPANATLPAVAGSAATEDDFQAMVSRLQQTTFIKLRQQPSNNRLTAGKWTCALSKEQILKVWRTPRHYLKTDDERKVYSLVHKYNGSYNAYMDLQYQSQRRQQKLVRDGVHIQWDKVGKLVSKDVDYRARQILREIDRASTTRNETIRSDVLHANDQTFPTKVLLTHLEEALDTLLIDQIKDRERAERHRVSHSDDDADNDDDDEGVDMMLDAIDAEDNDADLLSKVAKRAKRRQQRSVQMKAMSDEKQVLTAKKVLDKQKHRSEEELADMILQSQLGSTRCCLACRTRHCRWQSCVDYDMVTSRQQEIDAEIERIRLDRDANVFESHVALSAQLGGNNIFRKQDLYEELNEESRQLQIRIQLDQVDKELHDCYKSRQEYFESHHLHGYSVLLWTNNARKALEARQNRLVSMIVAHEVVEDILENMLEGWVFGERQSNYHALGFVPTIKKEGMIRAGQEQITSIVNVIDRMRKRAQSKQQGILTDDRRRGQMIEKAYEIELKSQGAKQRIKVARDKNEHEHLLNETEQTLRFGLFMITLMYFRAMTFVRREQRSWNDMDDELAVGSQNKKKGMTDERMKMIDEENKVRLRRKKIDAILAKVHVGDQRRREREEAERREAVLRLQAIVRRQKLEAYSIILVQKIYRGHLGRKAAKRWALKRAELGAMNALLNATAITIQRVFRGYRARVFTIFKRMEMAQFISLMRVQETQQDEEIFWQTHPWTRFKRNRREWYQQKMEQYRTKKVLGGSRLTAEEQAQLEGKSLDAIKRELQGLGSESEDEDGDEDEDTLGQLAAPSAKTGSTSAKSKQVASSKSSKSQSQSSLATGSSVDDYEEN